ncbi:MAG: HEAT repeat domain-containing protein [Brevinematia bacterium]
MRRILLIVAFVSVFSWVFAQSKEAVSHDSSKSSSKEKKEYDVISSLGPEDVDLIIDLTYSDNYDIAQRAVYRLGQIKSKKAFDRLISIFLFSGYSVEKGFDEVILASIWSLGELGDKRAIDPLIDNYDRFKSVSYKVQIIRAIGKLGKGSEKAFVFLDRVIKSTDNNMIAFEVVKSLENIGKVESIKTLSEVLKSGRFEKWVNREIERVISNLGSSNVGDKEKK